MSLISFSFSQDQNPLMSEDYRKQKKWTDSIYTSLTLDEKIGQLFMPIVFSKHDESHKAGQPSSSINPNSPNYFNHNSF